MVNFNSLDPGQTVSNPATQPVLTDRLGEFVVQYGSGPAGDTGCAGDITWSSTPSASTNHVRVFIQNKPGTNAVYQRTDISIALQVIGGEPADLIPTWVSYTQLPGIQTFDTMTAAGRTWVTLGL